MTDSPRPFLTAEWRNLVMLNYVVDQGLLEPLVPSGTQLDNWNGKTYISLVGFLFAGTKVLGLSIPFHTTFEEVNLRFYVRREVGGEVRRGVTFIKEIVPRAAIATVARIAYNEAYVALPMRHAFGETNSAGVPTSVDYSWKSGDDWTGLRVETGGDGRPADEGSEEQFITEHYWGYTRQRDGSTVEYHVAHERWRVWAVESPNVFGNLASTYGDDFARIVQSQPSSAFLADGSAVTVFAPTTLPAN